MDLFDGFVSDVLTTAEKSSKRYAYAEKNSAAVSSRSELILLKDCAFELGGSDLPCVGFTLITQNIPLINETMVIGKDISDIDGDSPFAKIVLLETDIPQNDDQQLYGLIKEADYVKYKANVSGFMSRASAFNHREQVRVSKNAVKSGLTFEKVGNALIGEYLKLPFVRRASVIFITSSDADFEKIESIADRTSQITKALNHIFDNLLMDCKHCNLKTICDEVDGMKELHARALKK